MLHPAAPRAPAKGEVMTIGASRRSLRRLAAAIATLVAATLAASGISSAQAAEPASGSASASVHMTPELHARIQKKVHEFRARHGAPGIAVAVVTPDASGSGSEITTFTAGVPEIGSPNPVDASTQFELGSETKVFTADLLSALVADGRVSLDDPVQWYAPAGITVPEWTEDGASTPITLRDLATHQAGLPDMPANLARGCDGVPDCVNPRPGYTQKMLWNALQNQTLLWQPGTNWLYSDWGFGLLGTILSNLVDPVPESDPPAYASALDTTFLGPLGMTSTMLEAPSPRLAVPYAGDPLAATWYWDNTNALSGGGGLISDTTDMGTWVAAHLGALPAEAPAGVQALPATLHPVSAITTSCSGPLPADCGPADFRMGLGWVLNPATASAVGAPWAFKNGDTQGSATDTALAPGLGLGVTTMFNQKRAQGEQLAVPLLALLVAELPAPSASPAPSPSSTAGADALAASGPAPLVTTVAVVGAVALLALGTALTVRRRRQDPQS